jgi:hypothetical protein
MGRYQDFHLEELQADRSRSYAVRAALAPATKMPGLYPGQHAKPTGRLIVQALAGLRLIPASRGQPAIIPQPTPTQARLLDLLAVDPTQPP